MQMAGGHEKLKTLIMAFLGGRL